ncbi:MAG: dihydrolipoyl dehydrogenase [Candidatus Dormibacteraeota bacterium]|nr:dihydrolipoyl dehydrogenase [Candidatus Dormibacteraeota bacterium]MBV9525312.1 dihydrolipoyl dehydrogenase [Candidatus Dormibacteraeota bacterium]
MAERFDLAILGGGMGGYPAAIRAAQLGMSVALVEEDKLGGTCLHRGCIPTKALLQSADLLDQLRHAGEFGVSVKDVGFDYAVAGKRRDDVVSQLHRGVEYLMKKNKVTVVRGHGRIAGAGRIDVSGQGEPQEVEAANIIIASGSRPKEPAGVDVDGQQVITSDHALTMNTVPGSAIVLGAGAVGVEFASLYRSCGADVTLVEMLPTLVPLEDSDLGAELQRQFESRGIRCLVEARMDLGSIQRNEGGVSVAVTDRDGREHRLQADVLLIAVGRSANVEDIGLDGTRVEVRNGAIVVDEMLRTAEEGISAIGDVAGGFLLAHKALHEGVIAVEAIAGRSPDPLPSRLVARTTYCSPQIGSLGLSEAEAKAAGHDVAIGSFPFRANGRALIWGEAGGFCKVVADRGTGLVLGVHVIGHEVTELIWGPALALLVEATPFEMGRTVAPHPTLTEVLSEAALAVSGEAIHI